MPLQKNLPSDLRRSLVSYAAFILGRRPYFSGRLKEKLISRAEKLGFTDTELEIDAIIAELKASKFIDDLYLAEGYTRKELHKGWGPKIILLKLYHLGVDSDTAQKAILAEADLSHQREAITHYLKKISRLDKRLQINRLLRRGFNSSAVLPLFDSKLSYD